MDNNKKDILFSVVMTTRNRAHLLSKAIDSVLAQTYPDWELIIVDDASEDNTSLILKDYLRKEPKIRCFTQETRTGVSAARNIGISKANGSYISFLDDDDYYLPGFLKSFASEIKLNGKPDGVFMCDYLEEWPDQTVTGPSYKNFKINDPIQFYLKFGVLLPLVIPIKALQKEKFLEEMVLGEDLNLLVRILLQHKLYYFSSSLCVYRQHTGMTGDPHYSANTYINQPFNQLYACGHLLENYHAELKKTKSLKFILQRYNKIAYFYASSCMKSAYFHEAFILCSKMKWPPIWISAYYTFSILGRIPLYFLKSLILPRKKREIGKG